MAQSAPFHTVLVVDDDSDVREALNALLTAHQFGVETADSAPDALVLLRTGLRPCVILLDIRMPGMDGWTLLEQLRRHATLGTIPVVIITGERSSVDVARARGAVDLLQKPFDASRIVKTVAEYCPAQP